MKKVFLATVLAVTSVAAFAQDGKLSVGLNVGYGSASDLEQLSFGVRASYDITEAIAIVPSFNYYLPKTETMEGCDLKLNVWDINCDFHYNALNKENFKLYPLAGITYMHAKATVEGYGASADESNGKLGVNLGVGAQFNISPNLAIHPELKYQIIDETNQLVPSVALMYKF